MDKLLKRIKEKSTDGLYHAIFHSTFEFGKEEFGDIENTMLFFNKLNVPVNSSILEIGCAIGSFLNEISQQGYQNISGIDIVPEGIEYGKKKYPHLNLSVYDGEHLPVGSYDVCVSFDVIEHIPDIRAHITAVYKIIRPGGQYILHTPNKYINSIIETIRWRGFFWRKIHPSLQTRRSLIRILRQAGFNKIEFYRISPLSRYKMKDFRAPLRFLLSLIPWTSLPFCLQTNFYVVAHK